jgi:hypothetical protein
MEPAQKKLSSAFNDFVNVLVDEELEPIRLDIIRIENDLKEILLNENVEEINGIVEKTRNEIKSVIENVKKSILEDVSQKLIPLEEAIAQLKENAGENLQVSNETDSTSNDAKLDLLKSSIDDLASKVSEVLKLDKRISVLENQFKGEIL